MEDEMIKVFITEYQVPFEQMVTEVREFDLENSGFQGLTKARLPTRRDG
jgi:hypothetical protein